MPRRIDVPAPELLPVVLLRDRDMLTQPQIDKLIAHPPMGWITAMTTVAMRGSADRALANPGVACRFL
jgi:hypothetical protein